MTEEDKWARDVFENKATSIRPCVFCAGLHNRVVGLPDHEQPCPRVKRVERNGDGVILVLEFWPNGEWEQGIVFPDSVYSVAEDEEEDTIPGQVGWVSPTMGI